MIPYPPNDRDDGISNHTFRTFMRRHNAMMFNFLKMNLFKAALTPELRSVVAQQYQETTMIKKMYRVATTAQREALAKHRQQSMKSKMRRSWPTWKTMIMTLLLLINEEHILKQASLAHRTTVDIKPIEEANNHQSQQERQRQ